MRILAISGSLRAASHNSELLRSAAALAPLGVKVDIYKGLEEIPPYDEDDDVAGNQPSAVVRLKQALNSADAVLIATPEYNASIPGVLKNALDWVSRPIAESPVRYKPAAVISASTSMFGGVWAAAETRKVLGEHRPQRLALIRRDYQKGAGGPGERVERDHSSRQPISSMPSSSIAARTRGSVSVRSSSSRSTV